MVLPEAWVWGLGGRVGGGGRGGACRLGALGSVLGSVQKGEHANTENTTQHKILH